MKQSPDPLHTFCKQGQHLGEVDSHMSEGPDDVLPTLQASKMELFLLMQVCLIWTDRRWGLPQKSVRALRRGSIVTNEDIPTLYSTVLRLLQSVLAWGYQLFNSELLSDDSITFDSLAKYILLHHL